MPPDLWGDLPGDDLVVPPVTILREQASLLGNKTNHVLEGDVRVGRQEEALSMHLDIVAPALDGYRFTVLTATHPVQAFPVTVYSEVTKKWEICNDGPAFEAKVAQILTSDTIRKVVASLLAQSKSGW